MFILNSFESLMPLRWELFWGANIIGDATVENLQV